MTTLLQTNQAQLQTRLDNWQKYLDLARAKHYYLNYLNPNQLNILHKYFAGTLPESDINAGTVRNIMFYINPKIDVSNFPNSSFRGDSINTTENEEDSEWEDSGDEVDSGDESGTEEEGLLQSLFTIGTHLDTVSH